MVLNFFAGLALLYNGVVLHSLSVRATEVGLGLEDTFLYSGSVVSSVFLIIGIVGNYCNGR